MSLTCFNTSHVTLYRLKPVCGMESLWCFNTSHVTLYHLANKCVLVITQFQYISCYSLSPFVLLLKAQQAGFNTSHVTLYRYMGDIYIHRRTVSIHLMLLFIEGEKKTTQTATRFNTSHVTLYPSTLQHFSHLTLL